MDPLGFYLPKNEAELERKTPNQMIRLFFYVCAHKDTLTNEMAWLEHSLTERVQDLALVNKVPFPLALLIDRTARERIQGWDQYDITLDSNEYQFTVNKLVLNSQSPYFRTSFDETWKESVQRQMPLEASKSIAPILDAFSKTGQLPPIEEESLIELFITAAKYQMNDLHDHCLNILSNSLDGIYFFRTGPYTLSVRIEDGSNAFIESIREVRSRSQWDFWDLVRETHSIESITLAGSSLEKAEKQLKEVIQRNPEAALELDLKGPSVRNSIPILKKWDDEITKRVRIIRLETAVTPTVTYTLSTLTLVIDLIKKCPSVEVLVIDAVNIDNGLLLETVLNNCPNLRVFKTNSKFNKSSFTSSQQHECMEVLEIYSPIPASLPKFLCKFPKLRSLTLGQCKEIDAHSCKALLALPFLNALSLQNSLSSQALMMLLGEDSHLKELSFSAELLFDNSYEILARSRLRKLHIHNASNLNNNQLTKLARLTSLTDLSISGSPLIDNNGVAELTARLRLTRLSFHDCPQLDNESLKIFQKMDALESLELSSMPAMTAFGKLHKCQNLMKLSISRSQAMNDTALLKLSKSYSLRKLAIHNCSVSPRNIENFLSLSKSVQKLDLRCSQVWEGMRTLSSRRGIHLRKRSRMHYEGIV